MYRYIYDMKYIKSIHIYAIYRINPTLSVSVFPNAGIRQARRAAMLPAVLPRPTILYMIYIYLYTYIVIPSLFNVHYVLSPFFCFLGIRQARRVPVLPAVLPRPKHYI